MNGFWPLPCLALALFLGATHRRAGFCSCCCSLAPRWRIALSDNLVLLVVMLGDNLDHRTAEGF